MMAKSRSSQVAYGRGKNVSVRNFQKSSQLILSLVRLEGREGGRTDLYRFLEVISPIVEQLSRLASKVTKDIYENIYLRKCFRETLWKTSKTKTLLDEENSKGVPYMSMGTVQGTG